MYVIALSATKHIGIKQTNNQALFTWPYAVLMPKKLLLPISYNIIAYWSGY